ncbi:MAG TPA: 50S ribosomal protein L25 [Pyrinomonadaceae bacterium]|nr:50S ribosomal protein L25 [Chloracidobacterium sp.]MBP9934586.1 50S ribosomal protein L25 [Pyrinomonadaceae bacterium]MBK7802865.1 50S ribosomal protein L25 [Chloracidobacterium sp.]MBK9438493.1 50S ribosomal protein L25 [Chloracidobacterium sp.]MBL0240628.1 50S ribosomal protein L25 [Chloracidobacterium sp.]
MAEKIVIKAEKRDTRGKNENRRLRALGKIPVVVYGGGSESLAATAELKDLAAIIRSDSGINTVFSLDIEGEGVNDVIFQARQIDAVRGRLIHADLRRFSKGEKIEMTVQIHLTGQAAGLQDAGAVLTQALREIKVLCEPANTPESIDVDVTDLAAGHSIHVSDLSVGAGIELLEAPETVVATIVTVSEVVLEPQLEAGAQPEVVGETPGDGGEA